MNSMVLVGIIGVAIYMFKDKLGIGGGISGISDKYDELFIKYGLMYGVSPVIIKAISANESMVGKYQSIEPIGGTTGIMHIKLTTAQQHEPKLTAADLRIPENEIRVATKHIKSLLDYYKQHPTSKQIEYAVKAYNGGQGRMNTILTLGDKVADQGYYKNMNSYWDKFNIHKNKLGKVA